LRGWKSRVRNDQDRLLAISSDPNASPLEGIDTREPAFGVAAKWIEASFQEQALASGYAVVDQASIIATHLAEIVRQKRARTAHTQETKRLLDALAEDAPQTGRGTRSAAADARRIAEGIAAIASRTSFDSGSPRHSRNAARYNAGEQESSSNGRSGAPGVGAFTGDAAPGRRSQN